MSDAQDAGEAVNQGWFAVRCVFQYGSDAPFVYEERITVWRALSFDAALALAEAEAAEYANEVDRRYLGFAQSYRMFDELGHGAEVYSLMRDSELSPDAYRQRSSTPARSGRERPGRARDTDRPVRSAPWSAMPAVEVRRRSYVRATASGCSRTT